MGAGAWIAELSARLGLDPPDAETTEALLALASTAAHQSERIAAPLACYVAGRAGLNAAQVSRLIQDLAKKA